MQRRTVRKLEPSFGQLQQLFPLRSTTSLRDLDALLRPLLAFIRRHDEIDVARNACSLNSFGRF